MDARFAIAALLALASLVAAMLWAFQPRTASHAGDEALGSGAPRTAQPIAQRRSESSFADDRAVAAPTKIAQAEAPEGDAGTAATSASVAAEAPAAPTTPDAGRWEDPTNERVLGRKSWMAPIDEAEEARINRVFDDARAALVDPRLPDRSRAASILAATDVVDRCFSALATRRPQLRGRLIVGWTAGATNGRGLITNPRIDVNYKLDDPEFETCVLGGLDGARFRGPDGDAIEVEAPFFYDN